MKIIKDELRIRNAELDDAHILCGWWNDGKIMAHAGFPKGLNTNIEKIQEIISKNNDHSSLLMIEHKDQAIGEMSYRGLKETAEIGIKICSSDYQDQGLGSRILLMFIESLFNDYHYERIILDTNLKNTRAQHVYEKLGFKKVKINYDSWEDQVGDLQSSIDYELLKTDFIEKR